ncbi:MAG: hypothetical protein JW940_16870, partial [Polyangiaceae bacterium]|nr:hypothetical protein [Polyangiaceae bacterium]
TAPASGDRCVSGTTCAYAGKTCTCFETYWFCVSDTGCPDPEPVTGSTCTVAGTVCTYADQACGCDGAHWTCVATRPCPDAMPESGEDCQGPALCQYADGGACACPSGIGQVWTCLASVTP